MRYLFLSALVVLAACTSDPPPLDNNGQSPGAVLLGAYQKILQGDFVSAERIFDPRWGKAVFPPSSNQTFEMWAKEHTKLWSVDLLKTELLGNDRNDNVWRVRVKSDEGKGKDNPAGAVHDLAQIDGTWRIVFWGDYPESQ